MSRKVLYDLYDNGKLVLPHATAKQIRTYLHVDTLNLTIYAENKTRYAGRYSVERSEDQTLDTFENFAEEWNRAIEPFKRVKWSKNKGRKLHLGG